MSEVKVNKIDKRTGSTLTIGGSGTTVTLACGATQTGFGRTGTVDWCTTAKTAPFTAVSGNGYFVNTTSGAVTVTLPASPSAGDIVSIKDYANTFDTNNLTLCRNGSKISGGCVNALVSTEGQSISMVYVDATRGWLNIQTDTTVEAPAYITASGGSISTSGNYKIHTFTGPGSFIVTAGTSAPNNEVSYLVVAGGGGGGGDHGGGGGAGGFREDKSSNDAYTASPLDGAGTINVTSQTYPITVGGGGTAGAGQGPTSPNAPQGSKGGNGSNSVFSTITSAGGGGGAKEGIVSNPVPGPNDGIGLPGGSGGGGSYSGSPIPQAGLGGTGNSPPVSPAQGNNGGSPTGYPGTASPSNSSSGGGGATAVGGSAVTNGAGGAGGAGATTSISGSPTTYSGGGGGAGGALGPAGAGGAGGGGAGAVSSTGTAGTVNTGGGGGGSYPDPFGGGAGGSGIVIIRYKYQN